MAPPRTLWATRLPDGAVARCVLVPMPKKAAIVWYVEKQIEGVEEFVAPQGFWTVV